MNDGINSSASEDKVERGISFKHFLESVHPSVQMQVSNVWEPNATGSLKLNVPDLHLHCPHCNGKRTFRSEDDKHLRLGRATGVFALYICGDCQSSSKEFALWIKASDGALAAVYKYGEIPSFGVPVPKKVLQLFGGDSRIFLKGRQCENQGLGIGAFAYYRRVVETHKSEIFDEIIRVCQTLKASRKLIEELAHAKTEVSFTKAVDDIKTALPEGLLVDGHNPLTALHGALSAGLHNESDEECLATASAVRLVLTDLVEKMSLLRQGKADLNNAVQLLLSKKDGVAARAKPNG